MSAVEKGLRMHYLEQYCYHIISTSSFYNHASSISYAPCGLSGKCKKYPEYGDFQECYCLRTYGNWWKQCDSYTKNYRPQDFDVLESDDFVVLGFEHAVVPKDICIYEVFNPGAVVRLWGRKNRARKWHLLWEGPPQKCKPEARRFCPPLRKVNYLVDIIRIEFNQSHLEYHTSIDSVLLGGYQPETRLQSKLIDRGLTSVECFVPRHLGFHNAKKKSKKSDNGAKDFFSTLPNEIILQIFQYLDLISLSRCAQVNKRWNHLSQYPGFYYNLNFKPYWNLVFPSTIDHFKDKCTVVKKLDMSWCDQSTFFDRCGLVNSLQFQLSLARFLRKFKSTITHLNLRDVQYVYDDLLEHVMNCSNLVELRMHNIPTFDNTPVTSVTNLVTLDISCTNVPGKCLITLLQVNPNLEHLIIDQCKSITNLDLLVEVASNHNRKLRTWSSWKVRSFTVVGLRKFARFPDLEDLDLGWCALEIDTGNSLAEIAQSCRKLKRLIISEWRTVSDDTLMPIVLHCKELSQIDLMGMDNISADVCGKALYLLPKLRLMDISYCRGIRKTEVEIWRQQYPHITIHNICTYARI